MPPSAVEMTKLLVLPGQIPMPVYNKDVDKPTNVVLDVRVDVLYLRT